jgi:hypothetical protein
VARQKNEGFIIQNSRLIYEKGNNFVIRSPPPGRGMINSLDRIAKNIESIPLILKEYFSPELASVKKP